MSFILEALKKSEQSRRFNEPQTLQSWQYAPSQVYSKPSRWIPWLVGFNLIVVLVLLALMINPTWFETVRQALPWPKTDISVMSEPQSANPQPVRKAQIPQPPMQSNGTTTQTDTAPGTQVMPREVQSSSSAMDASVVDESASSEVISPADQSKSEEIIRPFNQQADQQVIKPKAVTGDANALDSTEIPALEDLPESLIIHIPAIGFSSHIYSTWPKARQVVVNGRKLREGDSLDELKLLQINEKDVIFSYSEQPFRVQLERYWSRDN